MHIELSFSTWQAQLALISGTTAFTGNRNHAWMGLDLCTEYIAINYMYAIPNQSNNRTQQLHCDGKLHMLSGSIACLIKYHSLPPWAQLKVVHTIFPLWLIPEGEKVIL